jgi:hypothetical protein
LFYHFLLLEVQLKQQPQTTTDTTSPQPKPDHSTGYASSTSEKPTTAHKMEVAKLKASMLTQNYIR